MARIAFGILFLSVSRNWCSIELMRSIYEYEKLERVKPIVDHGIKALSAFISRCVFASRNR